MNKILFNGEILNLEKELNVEEFIHRLNKGKYDGIAVAINGRIVPRNHWRIKKITDKDRIDIVEAFQGG